MTTIKHTSTNVPKTLGLKKTQNILYMKSLFFYWMVYFVYFVFENDWPFFLSKILSLLLLCVFMHNEFLFSLCLLPAKLQVISRSAFLNTSKLHHAISLFFFSLSSSRTKWLFSLQKRQATLSHLAVQIYYTILILFLFSSVVTFTSLLQFQLVFP